MGAPIQVYTTCHLKHITNPTVPLPISWAPPQRALSKTQMRCHSTQEKSSRQGTTASSHSPHLSLLQAATPPAGSLRGSTPWSSGLCTSVCVCTGEHARTYPSPRPHQPRPPFSRAPTSASPLHGHLWRPPSTDGGTAPPRLQGDIGCGLCLPRGPGVPVGPGPPAAQ